MKPEGTIIGWLGIPTAFAAFVTNLRFSPLRQPRTPLRMLSLIAVTWALRSRGIKLPSDRRQAVIEAMELGALLNDRFDGDSHDREELRARMRWFAGSAHRDVIRCYVKRLCRLERARPEPGDNSTAVRQYRENVNRLSLATLWALGRGGTLAEAELAIGREADLRLLFQIVMQAQVIDDGMDLREDRRRGLPSFATGGMPLREAVRIYADAGPIALDRIFCLRFSLRAATGIARLVAARATRAASGSR